MSQNQSSNAVLAKARAMYGKHLTVQNYSDLISCRTVGEVAYYLKNHTDYRFLLSGLNESDVHRGQLEQLLKRKMFEDGASLCLYEMTAGEPLSDFVVHYAEISQILHAVTYLMSDRNASYTVYLPAYLEKHSSIDLQKLGAIESYADLLSALDHTPYQKLLSPFLGDASPDYTGIETALYTFFYKNTYLKIRERTSGKTQQELCEFFDLYIRLENLMRILRLRQSYDAGADFIRSCLIEAGTFREKRISVAIEAPDAEKTAKALSLKVELPAQSPELLRRKTIYKKALHNLRFSICPPVVMISYFFLCELEMLDITTIIEGIRYQLPQSDIRELLTIINCKKTGGD